jgi:tousled-like kinase
MQSEMDRLKLLEARFTADLPAASASPEASRQPAKRPRGEESELPRSPTSAEKRLKHSDAENHEASTLSDGKSRGKPTLASFFARAKAAEPAESSELSELRKTAQDLQTRLREAEQSLLVAKEIAEASRRELSEREQAASRAAQERDAATSTRRRALQVLARSMMRLEDDEERRELAQESLALGRPLPMRATPVEAKEELLLWEDGLEVAECKRRLEEMAERRRVLEERRKVLQKNARQLKKDIGRSVSEARGRDGRQGDVAEEELGSVPGEAVGPHERVARERAMLLQLDHSEEDEAIKAQMAASKREEAVLTAKMQELERRKEVLRRRLSRAAAEGESPLRTRPLLRQRYQLLRLLGRGGFSEVWRALDLETAEQVAVKVHRTHTGWKETRKQMYIRHAVREYQIHQQLQHQHVVRLLDVFEIDDDAFATVLELCRGPDLDAVLKERGPLPEKEARAVILQVFSALRYLAGVDSPSSAEGGEGVEPDEEKRLKIIHYDLKPANILFDEHSMAKVTDFGLSKILEDSSSADPTSMELTSQGAGTYWYLPPECFATGGGVRISNKVDVWALGVIFFQALYGSRPFGEGLSQEALLRKSVMLHAKDPVFPDKPAVSDLAKDFMRVCLAHDQRARPDVRGLCSHPYLLAGGATSSSVA